jgi:hypothetical protein
MNLVDCVCLTIKFISFCFNFRFNLFYFVPICFVLFHFVTFSSYFFSICLASASHWPFTVCVLTDVVVNIQVSCFVLNIQVIFRSYSGHIEHICWTFKRSYWTYLLNIQVAILNLFVEYSSHVGPICWAFGSYWTYLLKLQVILNLFVEHSGSNIEHIGPSGHIQGIFR